MKKAVHTLLMFSFMLLVANCKSQDAGSANVYLFKAGDPNGIGKWYMGREISHVMGYQGIDWLERPEREKEENTVKLLMDMQILPGDTIADIGSGSGYYAFKIAPMAKEGLVYAVDIQDEMLEALRARKKASNSKNIAIIKGSIKSVNLPSNSVDKVLLVDVYHEFSYPVEMIASIKNAMRHDAKLYLIEYRGEDDQIPIKKLHKMTEKQAVKELKAAGFKMERNIKNLPWQHCMVFIKD